MLFFTEKNPKNLWIHVEQQKILDKQNKPGDIILSNFKIQSYCNQWLAGLTDRVLLYTMGCSAHVLMLISRFLIACVRWDQYS
jgi:hypothetical protein